MNGHGGNLRRLQQMAGKSASEILDFSANINPQGFPDWLRPLISRGVSNLVHYPDPDNTALLDAAARRYGATPGELIAGNGSSELLYLLAQAARLTRAVIPVPSYADYARAATVAGMRVEPMVLQATDGFHLDMAQLGARLTAPAAVFIGHPNNPTGRVCDAKRFRVLAKAHPNSLFIVDEAFGDFVQDFDSLTTQRPANVAVLLSLTKMFAIPGLRLGCAVADAALVARLRERQPPWSVNTMAQAAGAMACQDTDYVKYSQIMVSDLRHSLYAGLQSLACLTPFPSSANFILVRINPPAPDAAETADRLLKECGIAIRVCDNFEGLDARFFRIAVRTAPENERLLDALRRALTSRTVRPEARRTPALMFQGTSSNAGKSVMTAAFCRIFLQDGYSVAPFKAQNMSLNSFVTRDGLEMGRAQVVQAQACRIEPDARMNPVLLKPHSDTGSQVIIMGKPVGNMGAGEYIRYKPTAVEAVRNAYDTLAAEHDIIVLEGAGSPGEVNLKHHDIVNMTMARYAGAPVLLVGDIDRGGVFASFIGTLEVLAEWERALVAGFVVNRFRGKRDLLNDALTYMLRHTGRPVFGVVPYLAGINLPEEDSVTFKNCARTSRDSRSEDGVDIVVLDLPHISNFTDFDALGLEPDVCVRVIRSAADIGRPDALILPGSKSVVDDLAWVRRSGFPDALNALARARRCEIIGICGGYQMLGRTLADPHRVESGAGNVDALGLLDLCTVMAPDKTLTRVRGIHQVSGLPLQGYEIHHGQSADNHLPPLIRRDDGMVIGAAGDSGLIWGTYLHGVFDADEFRRWFINRLRTRRGLTALNGIQRAYDLEPAFDRLADVVRREFNLPDIYRLMGLA